MNPYILDDIKTEIHLNDHKRKFIQVSYELRKEVGIWTKAGRFIYCGRMYSVPFSICACGELDHVNNINYRDKHDIDDNIYDYFWPDCLDNRVAKLPKNYWYTYPDKESLLRIITS